MIQMLDLKSTQAKLEKKKGYFMGSFLPPSEITSNLYQESPLKQAAARAPKFDALVKSKPDL